MLSPCAQMNKFLIAVSAGTILQPTLAQTPAINLDPPSVWDLRPLYPSTEAWDNEREALGPEIEQLRSSKGTLGQSPVAMANGFDDAPRVPAIGYNTVSVVAGFDQRSEPVADENSGAVLLQLNPNWGAGSQT